MPLSLPAGGPAGGAVLAAAAAAGVEPRTCNQCDLCGMACHGAAAAAARRGLDGRPSASAASTAPTPAAARASAFHWAWPWRKKPAGEPVDLSKRAMLASAVGGLADAGLLRTTPQAARHDLPSASCIRPPGARPEREFLHRCTACGLCMKVCPTGGLQPAWSEAGLEGLWTPRLVPQIGYCDYNCNLCGQVCPTEAIRAAGDRGEAASPIGLAAFDTTRCIPYAYGRDCMVCEEHCPIPDKAIYSSRSRCQDRQRREADDQAAAGRSGALHRLRHCENVCPFKDRPAVRVSSANETRHPDNQPILPGDDQSPY